MSVPGPDFLVYDIARSSSQSAKYQAHAVILSVTVWQARNDPPTPSYILLESRMLSSHIFQGLGQRHIVDVYQVAVIFSGGSVRVADAGLVSFGGDRAASDGKHDQSGDFHHGG